MVLCEFEVLIWMKCCHHADVKNKQYFFQIIYWTYYQGTFNWQCNPAPGLEDTSEVAQKQVYATYLYFLLKLLDLLDTVSKITKQIA